MAVLYALHKRTQVINVWIKQHCQLIFKFGTTWQRFSVSFKKECGALKGILHISKYACSSFLIHVLALL